VKTFLLFLLAALVLQADTNTFKVSVKNENLVAAEYYIFGTLSEGTGGEGDDETVFFGPFTANGRVTTLSPLCEITATAGAGYTIQVVWTDMPSTLLGNSLIATGDSPTLVFSDTQQLIGIGDLGPMGETLDTTMVITVVRQTNPDNRKTLWVTDDSTLTGDLFREGIDKIVAFQSEGGTTTEGGGGGGGTEMRITNGDTETTTFIAAGVAQLSAAETGAAELVTAMGEAEEGGVLALEALSGGDEIFRFDLSAFGVAYDFALTTTGLTGFGDLGATFNGILDWLAPLMHETLLLGAAIAFVYFVRKDLYEWIKTAFLAPQLTTKNEPGQNFVPGVGWTKQLAVALNFFGFLVVAITGSIVVANTNLDSIIGGMTMDTITGGVPGVWSEVTGGSTRITAAMTLIEKFIPIVGLIQFWVAEVIVTAAIGPLFMACLSVSKVLHP